MPGLVIGKVAIKVLPDTDGFREKVKRDLNGKEKPSEVKVKVIPVLDDSAWRNIQRKLEGLDDVDVNVEPELDRGDLAQVEQALARISDVDVMVEPEISDPAYRVTAARLATLARDRWVRIKTIADITSLNKTTKGLADAFSRLSGLRFTLDQFAKFRQEMLHLDAMIPKIGFLSHGLGSLSAIALTAGGSLLSVSAGLIQMGAAGLALPGLLGGIAIGAGLTATAFAAIKDEAPALVGWLSDLKGIIQGAFWAEASAPFERLGEALEEVNPLVEKTSTALGKFWGDLADDIRTSLLPELPEMFANLDKSIAIFGRSTDSIANIIATLGKLGSKYLPDLASWFGDLTDRFSDFLTAADKAGKLTDWVDTGIERIKELGRITGATASIFTSLAKAAERAGGATLGSVADGLERVAKAASSPGFQKGLTDTLSAAYEMMDQISSKAGPALAELIESLSETFQEMSSTMGDTVGTAIDAIARALASPALQNGLEKLLSGFNRMVHELAPAMQPLADKLGALGGVVGELADTVGQVLGSAIETVSPAFVALADAITPIVDRLGPSLSGLIDDLAPAFDTLAGHIEDAAPKLEEIADAFLDIYDAVGPLLGAGLEKVVDILGKLANLTLDSIAKGMRNLADSIETIKDAIKTGDFKTAAEELPETLFRMWNPAIAGLADKIRGADWSKIGEAVRDKFETLVETDWTEVGNKIGKKIGETIQKAVTDLILDSAKLGEKLATWIAETPPDEMAAAFVQLITQALMIAMTPGVILGAIAIALNQIGVGIVTGIVEGIVPDGLIQKLVDVHQQAFDTIGQQWESVRTMVSEKWEAIKNSVVTKAENLRANAVQKFENLRTNASQKFEAIKADVTQKIENLRANAVAKFESLRAQAVQKAESLRASAVAKFESIRSDVAGKIESLRANAAQKWESIRSTAASKWESIKTTIGDAAGKIKKAVSDKVDDVVSYMRDVPGKIKGALGDLGTLLYSAGASLIQGLIDGIQSKIGAVQSKLGDLTAMLPDWKGPAEKDARLLTPAGELIMQSLIDGFENKFDAVRKALTELTGDIVDTLGTDVVMGVSAEATLTTASMARQITAATRENAAASSTPASTEPSITIGNITIPLEDLKQLKDLEDFMELLRVRTRMG